MGLSGSGKSTLVRCISRLIEPTSGTVKMDDVDVTKMSGRDLLDLRRNKMSMVFQHFGLFPHRTVIENIGYGLEARGTKKDTRNEKSMEVLKMVGLDGWQNNYQENYQRYATEGRSCKSSSSRSRNINF